MSSIRRNTCKISNIELWGRRGPRGWKGLNISSIYGSTQPCGMLCLAHELRCKLVESLLDLIGSYWPEHPQPTSLGDMKWRPNHLEKEGFFAFPKAMVHLYQGPIRLSPLVAAPAPTPSFRCSHRLRQNTAGTTSKGTSPAHSSCGMSSDLA